MSQIDESVFGRMRDRQLVKKFTFQSLKTSFSFTVLTYGTIVQSINFMDKWGKLVNVCLGFDKMEGNFFLSICLVHLK